LHTSFILLPDLYIKSPNSGAATVSGEFSFYSLPRLQKLNLVPCDNPGVSGHIPRETPSSVYTFIGWDRELIKESACNL
jgi:hypothetical protein